MQRFSTLFRADASRACPHLLESGNTLVSDYSTILLQRQLGFRMHECPGQWTLRAGPEESSNHKVTIPRNLPPNQPRYGSWMNEKNVSVRVYSPRRGWMLSRESFLPSTRSRALPAGCVDDVVRARPETHGENVAYVISVYPSLCGFLGMIPPSHLHHHRRRRPGRRRPRRRHGRLDGGKHESSPRVVEGAALHWAEAAMICSLGERCVVVVGGGAGSPIHGKQKSLLLPRP